MNSVNYLRFLWAFVSFSGSQDQIGMMNIEIAIFILMIRLYNFLELIRINKDGIENKENLLFAKNFTHIFGRNVCERKKII